MEHLHLNKKLSALAKEKGFNEKVIAMFGDGTFYPLSSWMGGVNVEEAYKTLWEHKEVIASPLYQQVINWLKQEHAILVTELWEGWEYARNGDDFIQCKTIETAISEALKLIP